MTETGLETLTGSIERITFHSEESGYCILKVNAKEHRDIITVVGNAANISAGEQLECEGSWFNDSKYGLQFKATKLTVLYPTTLKGMEKYLGSGMVKGIGPHFAKKLVKAFGDQVFNVIENEPERLRDLPGMGEKRTEQLLDAWYEQQSIREIMVFLQSYGLGTARAVRIYKTYGDDAIDKVTENPYRLAMDVRGIGFKVADSLALELGIESDSLIRAQAGVKQALQDICNQGHCFAEDSELIESAHELLDIPRCIIEEAIESEKQERHIVEEIIDECVCFYPIALYMAETKSAEHVKRLLSGREPWDAIELGAAIAWSEGETGLELAQSQRHALDRALQSKVSIITGGPGVGKTTLINGFLKIIEAMGMKIALCAPTGRAAKRLKETTGIEAKTIHRLLEVDPATSGFKHNGGNPLPCDVVIVDEASMMDILLFNHLLKAIPDHAGVVFVGDIDQLPSVGPGSVLADLINSNAITTVHLTEIFRQEEGSHIISTAHRINQGLAPLPENSGAVDFVTLHCDTPEKIHETLVDLVSNQIPRNEQCNPMRDIQVLSPMNKGGLGCRSLNIELQKKLNPHSGPKISRFGYTYSVGDRVIQTTNNYDKDVFNGDIGFIEGIDLEASEIQIRFDQEIKLYEPSDLDEISLAYAITIHKSQGSEFPIVVIPLAMQHYMLLARKLLYTGVTRGKQLVVLVGEKKAIEKAVKNNKEAHRKTHLAERVRLLVGR
jgi:exodeoxyribonuclease V alpha subunit